MALLSGAVQARNEVPEKLVANRALVVREPGLNQSELGLGLGLG